MSQKLSPPLLSGSIPAFCSTEQGIEITIPYSMNRVVSLNQVSGFQIKIKTVQGSSELITVQVDKVENQGNEIKLLIFKHNEDYKRFKVGQYYKIQVAYINNDNVIGYYSSVAVAKYTTKPFLAINRLEEIILNSHEYTYTGIYDQSNGDKTERVYSYKFNLYNPEGELIDTSGDLLHDTTKDDLSIIGKTEDTYTFSRDLDTGKAYRIEYIVTTTNNLVMSTPRYRITQKQSISPEIKITLHAILNPDNGYVDVDMKAISDNELASGFFVISRACEDSDYMIWDEIHRFSLMAQIPTKHLHRDFTVEQGKNYIYAIQQYNKNNLYSNRILSNIVYVDFEDAFLFDGKRQLKIRYNPKITSFKKNLLETKTDTIGGKHPFIFRNGRVNYSEFPISGLISYQMDEENLFLSKEDFNVVEKTTNLTKDNITAERLFKMKVLEWLTNGEPKIFRSPEEGNYIVRLMNSSLSPNDTVGRMLHTFSSTAYEIADFNYSTLGEMGFITVEDQNMQALQWETIEFIQRDSNGVLAPIQSNINLLPKGRKATTIRFDNMNPGDIIKITFENEDEQLIKIGVTGSYYINTGISISEIKLSFPSIGSMTYSYYYNREPAFNFISDVSIVEMPQHQFIGEHNILKELLYVNYNNEWIKNPKLELIDIYRIDIEKRPLQRLNYLENKEDLNDPFLLYELGYIEYVIPEGQENSGVSPSRPEQKFHLKEYYDGYNGIVYDDIQNSKIYEPYILINGEIISVNEIEETSYIKPGKLNELQSGNGVLINIAYQLSIIEYNIENIALNNKDPNHYLYNLGKAIKEYNTQLNNLNKKLSNEEEDSTASDEEIAKAREEFEKEIMEIRAAVTTAYTKYIYELVKAQEEDARRRGEIV